MATKKKLLEAAAGSAGGDAALNVEDVFSTYLYTGTGSTLNIVNGIDLDGEGGLTWLKHRSSSSFSAADHWLIDTERGGTKYIRSNSSAAQSGNQNYVTFNSNGFTLGTSDAEINFGSGNSEYASFSFRKAPKFFTCLTYTGDGTTNRQISHDLGSAPGCIIVKRTNGLKDWAVYHRGKGNTHYGTLNTNEAFYDNATWWQDTDPTSTDFTVGNSAFVNANGDTYVAYLFAHNNGDGEFGPDADQDIIKCGSYDDTSSQDINLGFEPQWILVKDIDATDGNWGIMDTMRGWLAPDGNHQYLIANGAQNEQSTSWVSPTSTGFKTPGFGNTYIYIAIRRGPMAVPESATDVFAVDLSDTNSDTDRPSFISGFPVDFAIYANPAAGGFRLTGTRLAGTGYFSTNATDAEGTSANWTFDWMNGWRNNFNTADLPSWMWRRAPGFMDVVAYTGTGANRTVSHNLGVAPEMMWVKHRTSGVQQWRVYHSSLGATKYLDLNNLLYSN